MSKEERNNRIIGDVEIKKEIEHNKIRGVTKHGLKINKKSTSTIVKKIKVQKNHKMYMNMYM